MYERRYWMLKCQGWVNMATSRPTSACAQLLQCCNPPKTVFANRSPKRRLVGSARLARLWSWQPSPLAHHDPAEVPRRHRAAAPHIQPRPSPPRPQQPQQSGAGADATCSNERLCVVATMGAAMGAAMPPAVSCLRSDSSTSTSTSSSSSSGSSSGTSGTSGSGSGIGTSTSSTSSWTSTSSGARPLPCGWSQLWLWQLRQGPARHRHAHRRRRRHQSGGRRPDEAGRIGARGGHHAVLLGRRGRRGGRWRGRGRPPQHCTAARLPADGLEPSLHRPRRAAAPGPLACSRAFCTHA